jgi:hypothetical protein
VDHFTGGTPLPLSREEEELVGLFRMANLDENIQMDGPLRAALEGIFELASWAYD